MAAYPYKEPPDSRYQWHRFLPHTEAERRFGYCTKPAACGGVANIRRYDDHFYLGAISGNPPACDMKFPGWEPSGSTVAVLARAVRRAGTAVDGARGTADVVGGDFALGPACRPVLEGPRLLLGPL